VTTSLPRPVRPDEATIAVSSLRPLDDDATVDISALRRPPAEPAVAPGDATALDLRRPPAVPTTRAGDGAAGIATAASGTSSSGKTGELIATRAEMMRLRAELAGMREKVRKLETPDATVVLQPRTQRDPSRNQPPAQPAPITPAPAPATPSAHVQVPSAHVQTPSARADHASEPAARPVAPAPTVPGPATPRQTPAPRQPRPANQPTTGRPTVQPTTRPAAKPAAQPANPPVTEKRATGGSALETGYAAVLADVLGVPAVPVTGNFFDDLGADSLLMARFCAKVRARPELPNVAIKDIYRTPTIATLAAANAGTSKPDAPARALADAVAAATTAVIAIRPGARTTVRADLDPETVRLDLSLLKQQELPKPVGTFSFLLCGFLQLLFLLGYPAAVSYAFATGAEWVLNSTAPLDIYVRSVGVAGGLFLGTALLPVAAKWLLVGRWKATQFPVWGLRYYRFWLVKTLIRTNPLVRFVGTPLYPFYLRLLGAKVGKGATILSPTIPVCTDLLTIGAGTVIRKQSSFNGYRAYGGMIQTGPVTIGSGVVVGESTVLDISTAIGDGAQLGTTSALHAGQSVPARQRWHGSPAEPTNVDYRAVPELAGGSLRRFVYSVLQLVSLFGVALPVGLSGLALLVTEVPAVQRTLVTLEATGDSTSLLLDVALVTTVLLVGGGLLAILVVTVVPRLLSLLVRPDRVYRLYGVAHMALRAITRLTNSKFATRVTGDSSYIVGYLKAIGYKFAKVEQTGSNFGTAVAHDTPFLCHVGSGTVVADGLTMVNADYSSSAFAVSAVRIGAHSFLGNGIFYPARSRVGDNCLLGTKVMVPIEGPVRHGVGLLGSPSFEIPRSVERDNKLMLAPHERKQAVARKNRHNLLSIAYLLISRWVYVALVVLLARLALDAHGEFGAAIIAALGAGEMLLTFVYFGLLDLTVRWLVALKPRGVSIYDRDFWRHERYWKVAADSYIQMLNGTPFKALLWRALGVKVGRRLFDDGALMTERSLVTIGDHCSLNERAVVQCHSQENDAFKSDRVVIGSGVTVGVGGFVHYGTTLGDGSVLEADSFLMKGEETSPYTRWGGNPASELGTAPAHTSWRKR
jgi:non-ribosomal peptide synthetase-like protein